MFFFWVWVRVVIKIRVRVKYSCIIIVMTIHYLYNKKHGKLLQHLCGTVGRDQDLEAKVYDWVQTMEWTTG